MPRLVIRSHDDRLREYLLGIAAAQGGVQLVLESPPVHAAIHLLEVHTPGFIDPVVLVAKALGPTTPQGTPLQLKLPDATHAGLVSASKPPRESDDDLDWLQTGPTSMSELALGSMRPSAPPDSMPPPVSDTARTLAPFLRLLVETRDAVRFAALVTPLGPTIRSLLEQSQTVQAWRLCSTLDVIAAEGSDRSEYARSMLGCFADLALLTPVAEKLLDGQADKEGAAAKLLVHAQKVGARALYAARVNRHGDDARRRFVDTCKLVGPGAASTIRKGLERLESRLSVPGAIAIAEDLVAAVPIGVHDLELDAVLGRYTRMPVRGLAERAIEVLARTRPG